MDLKHNTLDEYIEWAREKILLEQSESQGLVKVRLRALPETTTGEAAVIRDALMADSQLLDAGVDIQDFWLSDDGSQLVIEAYV